MLSKLAVKNIKKSISDYLIYFSTLVVGVAIFYVFGALSDQTSSLVLSRSGEMVLEDFNKVMSGLNTFVAIILGVLIIYANRFLIKRRKKEFGIYLTLGMSKHKVAFILFTETFLIGLFSLIIGLILGIFLSQFMSVIVSKVFEADMSKFRFSFSLDGCLKTLLYFGVMYLVVILFNTVTVSQLRLISLLQASRKSERLTFNKTPICIVFFILSVITCAIAYYFTISRSTDVQKHIVMFCGIIFSATLAFFWSFSGILLKLAQKNKRFYLKGLNPFVLRQLSSKANTMVFSMTIISGMLTVTICILSLSVAYVHHINKSIREMFPVDVMVYEPYSVFYPFEQATDYNEDSRFYTAREFLTEKGIDVDSELKDVVEINVYFTESVSFKKFLGDHHHEIEEQFLYAMEDYQFEIMRESDYNKVAQVFGSEKVDVESGNYVIISNMTAYIEQADKCLKEGRVMNVSGMDLKPQYEECKDGSFLMSDTKSTDLLLIISDDVPVDDLRVRNYLYANYVSRDIKTIDDELLDIGERTYHITDPYCIISKRDTVDMLVSDSAHVLFICLYIGVVFLLSSAAVIALKELSESADNVERYDVLRQLGADQKMIDKALFSQIGTFFALPMGVALIHSIFLIRFGSKILEEPLFSTSFRSTVVISVIVIVLAYFGYFLLTYFSSRKIINSRSRG